MTAQTETQTSGGRVRQVGRVLTTLTVTNAADEAVVASGGMAADEVRRLSIADVLVDTGAMSLCLPIDIVQRLGLPKLRDVMVTTATGDEALELYDYARIEIAGRSALFDCVALPVGSVPLLGVLPLEALGLEPDLLNQRLRLLPETGRGGRYFAMSPIIY